MSSTKLKTNGEWLVWARRTAHYKTEDIAKKIQKNPETIKKWEKTGEIAFKDLEKLAEEYQRPTTIFFNDDAPEYERELIDFRTIGSIKKDNITPEIAFEIRRARVRRQTLLNLEHESDELEIPLFPFDKFQVNNIDDNHQILRDLLGLNRVRMKEKLEHWTDKIESLGVLIFEFYGISPEKLRGYALYYDKLPIIGINHRETANPKKFTLFHELAHITMKKEGISNLNEYQFTNNEEFLCNKIAAETLIPDNLFIERSKSKKMDSFNVEDIKNLANYFHVSKQLIVRRALTLNLITKEEYNDRTDEFKSYINKKSKKQNKKSDNTQLTDKETDPKIGLYNKAIIALRKNGKYFTKSLFEAYNNELITDIDLTLELGVSLDVMRKMKEISNQGESNESS